MFTQYLHSTSQQSVTRIPCNLQTGPGSVVDFIDLREKMLTVAELEPYDVAFCFTASWAKNSDTKYDTAAA